MSSLSVPRKRKVSSKQGGRMFALEFYDALQDNQIPIPKIYIDNVLLLLDCEPTLNQTQVHIDLNPDGNVRSLGFRSYRLPIEYISALHQTLPGWSSLSDLRFEHCNLAHKHLVQIRLLLEEYPNINNVFLNGNPDCFTSYPHPEQATAILLRNTHLKSYSMVLCNLHAQHLKNLCYTLSRPDSHSKNLVYLNLSCNKIDDEGCFILARVLRTNRTLQALNVSENMIGAEALCQLFAACRKFQLSNEEINYKRQIKITHGMKDMNMEWSSASWLDSQSLMSENLLGGLFVNDVFLEDGAFYSWGNNTLVHLNISYNEITRDLLEFIIDTIKYQQSYFKNAGLSRIVFEAKETFPSLEETIQTLLSNPPTESNRSSRVSKRPNSVI